MNVWGWLLAGLLTLIALLYAGACGIGLSVGGTTRPTSDWLSILVTLFGVYLVWAAGTGACMLFLRGQRLNAVARPAGVLSLIGSIRPAFWVLSVLVAGVTFYFLLVCQIDVSGPDTMPLGPFLLRIWPFLIVWCGLEAICFRCLR